MTETASVRRYLGNDGGLTSIPPGTLVAVIPDEVEYGRWDVLFTLPGLVDPDCPAYMPALGPELAKIEVVERDGYLHGMIPADPDDVPRIVAEAEAAERRAETVIPATVQLLTTKQACAELPDLFVDHPDDGRYFNELLAHGNAHWVDYWPDLVLVVRNSEGRVVMASNASRWHMEASGYGEHLPAEEEERHG